MEQDQRGERERGNKRAKGEKTNIHLDHLGSVGIGGWIKFQSAVEWCSRCGGSPAVTALRRSITLAVCLETSNCRRTPALGRT